MPDSIALKPSDGPDSTFTLEQATAGLAPGTVLWAHFRTTLGTVHCRLFATEAPRTVANFVGLARGLKAWKDPKSGEWVRRPLYNGTVFHRVIPNFMIQGGDPLGNGRGGPGYRFADEIHPQLRHDAPGTLSMANAGPNTNGSQFFLTDVPTPWLDGKHAVFGRCEAVDLVRKIAAVPRDGSDRPLTPVVLEAVDIERSAT